VRALKPEDLPALIDVSRETVARFAAYLALLGTWNARINLVGPKTLEDPWRRHILDCAQVFRLLPPGTRTLVDAGSGAGLPGLILAIQGVPDVHLIESDTRKAAFLFEAARHLGVDVTIHATRIEAAPPILADAVTARALKPLPTLIGLTRRFLAPTAACFFHKGESWRIELSEAQRLCHCTASTHASLSDPAGAIIQLGGIAGERP